MILPRILFLQKLKEDPNKPPPPRFNPGMDQRIKEKLEIKK